MKNGKSNYGSGLKIKNNVASALSLIGQVSEGYKKSGEDFIRKGKYSRKQMEAEDILYNFLTTPMNWNERNWKYKAAFALSLLALGGIAYASSDTVKKTTDNGVKKIGDYSKSAGKKISGGASGMFVGIDGFFKSAPPGIVVPAANASAVATPQATETPYSYDARASNPDPSIPFINGSGDKEWEEALNWNMEQFKKFSAYDVDEFQKYLVFRAGKNPTPGIMQHTKDKREIFYTDDFSWTSGDAIKKMRDANRVAWGFFSTAAHETGHKKDKTVCAPTDSRCIEIPAIEYETDAIIRVGIFRSEDREKMINSGWQQWKKQHNYVDK